MQGADGFGKGRKVLAMFGFVIIKAISRVEGVETRCNAQVKTSSFSQGKRTL